MSKLRISETHVVDARPEVVYGVISDYKVGHPAILPKPYFTDLKVEQGGKGAGTVILVKMKVWGQEYTYHQQVTEPEPGRVLAETDLDTGQFTTFTVDPLNGGQQTRVTITSEFPHKPGIAGFLERLIQPRIIRNIYQKELHILADYVKTVN